MNMHCHRLFALAIFAQSAATFASPITYSIDPTRSSLTGSGTFQGKSLEPFLLLESGNPTPISLLVASYTGTISADRDIAANTFQITGGNIAASQITGGSIANANYEFGTSSGGFPPLSSFQGTIHDFSISLSSPVIDSSTSFDSSRVLATIVSGQLAYALIDSPPHIGPTETDGSSPIGGNLAFAPDSASLVGSVDIETLTIPVNTDFTIDVNGEPLAMHLSGALVATTPEPSSLALLVTPVLLIFHRRRYRVK